MTELLRDNIEAGRRRDVTAGSVVATILASTKPRCEVPNLLSWIQCFSMYACVLGESYPELRRGLWAYQIFIVRKARRCRRGWQEYDSTAASCEDKDLDEKLKYHELKIIAVFIVGRHLDLS